MRKARESARNHTRGQTQSCGHGRVNTPLHVKDPNAASPHVQMEHIASVSRSSGLEKGGDALKDFKVQEQYRVFVGEKLHKFWTEKQTKDGQENVLILFRKLREGVFASKRSDAFAIEAYETSLFLSSLFDSPSQTSSILSHLLPELYTSASIQPPITSILILLLHHLNAGYPSQRTYFDHLSYLSPNVLDRTSEAYEWISNLATSLRTHNYIRFDALSRHDVCESLISVSPSDEKRNRLDDLPRDALQALVDRLRDKARDGTWMILRSAYRELSVSNESRAWLVKCLLLSSQQASASSPSFEEWMDRRCQEGHLRPKEEGAKGRWIVCKAR